MNHTENPTKLAAPARKFPKQKGILWRLWQQMIEVSEVAAWHRYHAPWNRGDL